jgi:hypothetical protein
MTAPSLTAYQPGIGVVTADNYNTFEQTCDTIPQLRAFIGLPGMQVAVRGLAAVGDGGGGIYYWKQGSGYVDNNGTVIVPMGFPAGAWLLLYGYAPVTTVFATAKALSLTSGIGSGVSAVMVLGFNTVGDSPKAEYIRVSSTPAYPGYVTTPDGVIFRLAEKVVYPEQIGTTGATDDSTVLLNANSYAQGYGAELVIDQVHTITNPVTFGVPVRFAGTGRLKPSAIGQITFNAGFVAPEHQFIFDFSNVTTGQTGSGLASAKVTSLALTPQMFGVVENSPSSSTSNTSRMQAWLDAVSVSRIPGLIPPVNINIGGQIVFDYSLGQYEGIKLLGSGGSSRLYFDAAVASPNFKITSTGPQTSGQSAQFYGEVGMFQIQGTPPNGSYPGIVLQWGEVGVSQAAPPVGGSSFVYFNGCFIHGITVNQNTVGGWAMFCSGLTNCDIANVTSDCNGNDASGSASFVWVNNSYNRWMIAPGNANYGIYSPSSSPVDAGSHINYCYANSITGGDFENLTCVIYNRSTGFGNNAFAGTFVNNVYLVDSTVGQGNVLGLASQITQPSATSFNNPTAANGTWGGYGFTIKMSQQNFAGQLQPFTTPTFPTWTTNTWYQNQWGQNYFYYVTSNQPITITKRSFYDNSSGGAQIWVDNVSGSYHTAVVKIGAGEQIKIVSTGTISVDIEQAD